MIKLVGFVTENDRTRESKTLEEYSSGTPKDSYLINRVVNYLDKGELIFGWMGYAFDPIDQTPIAPHAYYTDGIWVWPSYLKYYLLKYATFNLDDSFLDYMTANNFNYESDYSLNLGKLENELSKRLKEAV